MEFRNTTGLEFFSNVAGASDVFNQYGDFIFGVIRSFARDEMETEDLFQDFFLTLASKPIPENIPEIKCYLYRAITRDILNSIHAEKNCRARIGRYAEQANFNLKSDEAANLHFGRDFLNIRTDEKIDIKSKYIGRYISVGLKKIRNLINKSD